MYNEQKPHLKEKYLREVYAKDLVNGFQAKQQKQWSGNANKIIEKRRCSELPP